MNFIPYKANEYLENIFYQVPKELFVNPYYKDLNSDSKLLYSILLDRLSVSRKNNWVDSDNNIFLIFSRKEAQEKLNLSDKTVTKAFKQLVKFKLINEKRQGFKKNNIIYVGKINHISSCNNMIRKNYDSRNENSTTNETENLRCSNNKDNKNNYSNNSHYKLKKNNYKQRNYDDLNSFYCNIRNVKE